MTDIGKIEELVKEELREANEKHPLFSSIEAIKNNAENLAAEAIQVAAMCQKMIDSEV